MVQKNPIILGSPRVDYAILSIIIKEPKKVAKGVSQSGA